MMQDNKMKEYLESIREFTVQLPNSFDVQKFLYGSILNEQYDKLILKHKNLNKDICKAIIYGHNLNNTDKALNIFYAFIYFYIGSEVKIEQLVDEFNDSPWDTYFNMCLYFFEENQIKKELNKQKFNQILKLSKKTNLASDQTLTQIKFQNIRTPTQIIDNLIKLFKIDRTVMERNKKKHFQESYQFLQKHNMIKEIKDKTKLLKIDIIVNAFVAQDYQFLKNKKIQDQDKYSVLQILFEFVLLDYRQLSIFLVRCNDSEKNKYIQKIQQIQNWEDYEKLVQVGRSLKKICEWDRTIDLYEYLISQAQQFDNSYYNVYLYFTICKIQFMKGKGQFKKALQTCNLALNQIIDYSKQKKYFYQSNKQRFIQLELLFLNLILLYIDRDNKSITEIKKYITTINQKNQIMIITKQSRSLNLIIQIFIKEILIKDISKIKYPEESYNKITEFFGIKIEYIKKSYIQDEIKNDDIKNDDIQNEDINHEDIKNKDIKLKTQCLLELFIMTQFVRDQKYHLISYLNRDYLNLFLNMIKWNGLAIEKSIQDQVFFKALKNKNQNEEYPQIDDQVIKQIQNNSDFKFRDDILTFYKKVKNELAPYLTNLFPQIEKFLYFSTRYQVQSQQLIHGMKEISGEQFGNLKRVIYQDQEYACKISIITYNSDNQYFSKQQSDQLEKLYSRINDINTLSEIEDYKIPYVIQNKHVGVEIKKLNDEGLNSIKLFSLSPIYQQFSVILSQSDEIKLKFAEKIAICLKQLQIKRIQNYNLNPESLLVDDNYDPVLITNGSQISDLIAKQNESSILAQINVDPEIQNQINRKNDVYSFGLILYYLFVCTRPPFNDMNQSKRIEFLSHRVLEEEISKIQIREIQLLINNCTRSNIDNRYTMSQVLYQFLMINPCRNDILNLLIVFVNDFPDITDQEYELIKEFQKISLTLSLMDRENIKQIEQLYEQLYRCQYLDKSVELQNQTKSLVFHKYQIIIQNKQLAFRQTLQCMRFIRNLINLNNKFVNNVTKFYNYQLDIQENGLEKSITFYIFCIDKQYQMDYLKYPQQLINLLKKIKEINKEGINVMALDQKFLFQKNQDNNPVLFNFLYSQRVQDDISKNQYGWQYEIDHNQQDLINNDVDLMKVYLKNIINQVNQENYNMELMGIIQKIIDVGNQFSTFKSMLDHVIPNKIEIKQNTTIYSDRSDVNQFCQIAYQIFVPQDPELQDIVKKFIISMKRYKKESSELNSGIIQKKTIGRGNYGKVKKVNFQGQDYAQKISIISYESDKQNQEQMELLKSRLNEINIITQIEDYEIPYVLKNIHIGFKFKQEASISRIKIFSLSQIYKPFSVIQNLNDLKQKIEFAEKIAISLIQLQMMDISHQDIKPDNLLVDDKGNPVVIDFGISINNFKTQPTDKQLYTLVYADPELVSKQGYSRKNDVYSFGITIYELFTCSQAYYDPSREFLQIQTHKENIQKIQNYQIQKLIQKCVQPSKESRFSLCQILYQFLTINLYRKDFGTLMKLFMEKFDDVAITKQEYELIKEFQNISVKIPQMDRKEIKLTEKISENFNRCQYQDHTLYFYQYQIEIKYKQLAFRQILQYMRYAINLLNPHKKNSVKNRQFYNYSLILEDEDQELSILFEIYFHDCNYQKEYQVIQQVIKIIPLDQVLIKISIFFLSIFKDFIAKLTGKLKLLNKTLRQINHCILQKFYFQFQLMRLQKNLKVQ